MRASSVTYRIVDLAALADARRLWQAVVAVSPDAWVWATYSNYLFRLAYLQSKGALVEDRSFILMRDEKPCGLAPVVIARDRGELVATYGDVPLSWPLLVPVREDESKNETLLFDELERRVVESGAGRLSLMLAPPSWVSNSPSGFAGSRAIAASSM